MQKIEVRNVTRGVVLAAETLVARTSAERRTGLLKHQALPQGQGLWLAPCEAVHTFWMKFAIDVLFLDKKRKVLKVRHCVVPWRMTACLRAHSVLELPAGTCRTSGTVPGDQLEFGRS